MTRRHQGLIAAGILVLGAGVWWLADRSRPAAARLPRPENAPALAGRVPESGGEKKPLEAEPAPGAAPEYGTAEFAGMAKARAAGWLASRGRDAGSLIAVWDVTGDGELLQEAAEKFPGDPVVCAAMVQHLFATTAPAELKRKWIGQFIEATPGNPTGHYYLASLCAQEGDTAGALAAMEKALAEPGRPDSFLRDRVMTVKEGAMAGGASAGEASTLALMGPLQRNGSPPLAGMGKFFRDQLNTLKQAGETGQAQALAETGLKVMTQMSFSKSPTLLEELTVAGYRKKFLTELDPETEIGDTGRSAREWLAADEPATLKALLDRTAETAALQTAPDAVRAAYTDRFVLEGEAAALRYFLEWKDAQKAGP